METTTNGAYDYALIIKREILALETLLDNWGEIEEDAERVRNGDAPEMEDDLLAECVAAQNELGFDEWPEDIVSTYLNDSCLELTTLRPADYENTGRARIEILRTCGGPRCDITRDTNDGDMVEISVHDGGNHSVVRVSVPTLAFQLDQLSDTGF